jgi:hypothetical protein
MSLTIFYHNPKRPDDAGMIMIAGQAESGRVVDQLEKRGFIVDKITFVPFARATPVAADRPPAASRLRTSWRLSE